MRACRGSIGSGASIDFFRTNPRARLQKIYFLGYFEVDADVLTDTIKSLEAHFA